MPHRIHEVAGELLVDVPDERFLPVLEEGWAALQQGELGEARYRPYASIVDGLRQAGRRFPTTFVVLVLALVCYPATLSLDEGVIGDWLGFLLIVPVEVVGGYLRYPSLSDTLALGEVWRLWTPAFLHFGLVHLAFNLLWLWEFGRRIELTEGGRRLVVMVLLLAPLANVAQYAMLEGVMFGGLSGVVYGLLGYIVTAFRLGGQAAYNLNAALVVALLLFLVVFSTGVTEPFGLRIANAAHWGGFVGGIVWALVTAPRRRETSL